MATASSGARWAPRRWRRPDAGDLLAAAVVGLAVGYGLLSVLGRSDTWIHTVVTDVAYLPMDVLVVLLARRAARRCSAARPRLAWRLVTAAVVCRGVGDVIWFWLEVVRGVDPYPSLADAGFLLFIPVMSAGLMAFPAPARTARKRAMAGLDALIVAVGGLMVVWYLVLSPLLEHGVGDPVTAFVLSAYPVGDLVLVFGMVTRLQRGVPAGSHRPLRLLIAGLLMIAAADICFSYVGVHGSWGPGWLPDLCWLAGAALFGLAADAWCRAEGRPARPVDRRNPFGINKAPYLAVAVAYGMLLYLAPGERLYPFGGLIIGAVAMTALVVARQVGALRENRDRAVTDSLTGIANRAMFHARLSVALAQARRRGTQVGVLLVDLDGFKRINDSLGHEAGDAVLVAVAETLRRLVRPSDTVARLGGDEFAVLITDVVEPAAAAATATRILTGLGSPMMFDGHLLDTLGSVGVAVGGPELSGDELVRRADVAMYAAKRAGPGRFRGYAPQLDTAALGAELRTAIGEGQFLVYYQPIFDLTTGRTLGVEALARWQHPLRGLLPAEDFIPLAEETGLIVGLGGAVMRLACAQLSGWARRYGQGRQLALFVNLSPRQMRHPSLVSEVTAVLGQTGFDPRRLVLEITEGSLVNDDPATIAKIESLRGLGIRFAIDDFGTGYSSLTYLKRLPLDILKIDSSFTADLLRTERDQIIGRTMVQLGRALGMEVVVEGIETAAQHEVLRTMSGLHGQGFHLARPMAAEELAALLDPPAVGAGDPGPEPDPVTAPPPSRAVAGGAAGPPDRAAGTDQ